MVRDPFIDLSTIDTNRILIPGDEIRKVNPQRYEMAQIDGIVHIDRAAGIVVGVRDVRDDEWWVRGHLPDRPLFPGILLCEGGAQLCSYYTHLYGELPEGTFIGFGGMDRVRFRQTVAPGDRVVYVARCKDMRSRLAIFDVQGLVEGRIVFEAEILGIAV